RWTGRRRTRGPSAARARGRGGWPRAWPLPSPAPTTALRAALARLDALESDNAGVEVVDLNDDEYGSTDEED
uniref:Uncharacterized protein n=1 Tax=Aegilops tauschii subsp. strangulata TaxID=200361 RepID=A0A453KE35_AEGTS